MFKRRVRTDDHRWYEHGNVVVDSAGLSPANACVPYLFPEIYNDKKLAVYNVISSFPTLDPNYEGVVYMMAKTKHDDPNGWVLGINTNSNKLVMLAPFSRKKLHIQRTYVHSAFSKYLSRASEKYFTEGRPSGREVWSTLHNGVAATSAMNVHIHQVTQYATSIGVGQAATNAAKSFQRASEDIEKILLGYCWHEPTARGEAVGDKINVAAGALDGLLHTLPSVVLGIGRSMIPVYEPVNEESLVEKC
ncbi:unnamed protein product [Urochloa humidicola]